MTADPLKWPHGIGLLGRRGLGTEKHYASWVRAQQGQFEADVRRAWGAWLPPTKGTPELHCEDRFAKQLRQYGIEMAEGEGFEPCMGIENT
jgi:hypothetical protein